MLAWLPQVLQVALRRDGSGLLCAAFRDAAYTNSHLFHIMVWLLRSEIGDDSDSAAHSSASSTPWLFMASTSKADGAKTAGKGGEDRVFRQRCAALLAHMMQAISGLQRELVLMQTTLVTGLF